MAKRGHHDGSLRKRGDERWEARVSLPDGTRKSFYAKTQAEARRLLTAAIRDLDTGLPLASDGSQTVAVYFTNWLDTIQPTVKPRTLRRYGVAIHNHLISAVGKVRLVKLSAQQLQSLYAAKQAGGLSPATVAHLHAVIHRGLEAALRLGLVARNVADLVTPPRAREREMQVLTPEQARQLLTTARDSQDRLEAIYVLALTSGMRLGELLALQWADVNLDTSVAQVKHTLSHDKGGVWLLGTPKTAKSKRRIKLTNAAVDALRAHRVRQLSERLALGEALADHDFIFTRADGEPLRGTHVQQRNFVALLKRAGLPIIRFHDLRHTAATLLLLQGINPKVVSELLGHSQVGITLGLYSHVLPDMQQDAANAMDRLFG